MNYRNNSHIIKLLINKQLANKKDVFPYFSESFDMWFLCSRFIDDYNEMWSYCITSQHNIVKGFLIYHSLTMASYENNYVNFQAQTGDLRKYNEIFNRVFRYDQSAITSRVVKAEHKMAVRHKQKMIDVRMLTI